MHYFHCEESVSAHCTEWGPESPNLNSYSDGIISFHSCWSNFTFEKISSDLDKKYIFRSYMCLQYVALKLPCTCFVIYSYKLKQDKICNFNRYTAKLCFISIITGYMIGCCRIFHLSPNTSIFCFKSMDGFILSGWIQKNVLGLAKHILLVHLFDICIL